MSLIVEIQCDFETAPPPSQRIFEAAAMFGLGADESRRIVVVPHTRVELPQRGIVFVTGPSGSGKSTVLRLLSEAAQQAGAIIIDAARLSAPAEAPLLEAFDLPLDETMRLLALVGLGDAFVMLRRPCELSDGQRWRLRLAQTMDAAGRIGSGGMICIVIDEFAATLDRLTASVIAAAARRWISNACRPICLIAATTHDDLLEPLQPDVLIDKPLGGRISVESGKGKMESHKATIQRPLPGGRR